MIASSASSQITEPPTPPITEREFAEAIYRLHLCKQQIEVRGQIIQRQQQENTLLTNQNQQLTTDNRLLTQQLNATTEKLNSAKRTRWLYIAGGAIGGIVVYSIINSRQ